MRIGIIYGGLGIERKYNRDSLEQICSILQKHKIDYLIISLNKKINFRNIKKCNLFFVIDSNTNNVYRKIRLFKYIYDNSIDFIGQREEVLRILRDKHYTNQILNNNNILTTFSTLSNVMQRDLKYPIIIKDNYGSSSEDVYLVFNNNEKEIASDKILKHNKIPLFEEYVVGREFTCVFLQICGLTIIMNPIEIKYNGLFYDYNAKNLELDSQVLTDPVLSKKSVKNIKNITNLSNKYLHTQFYSRLDLKLNKQVATVIEMNGEPALSADDFVALGFYQLGFNYEDLIFGLLANSEIFKNFIKINRKKLNKRVKYISDRLSSFCLDK
ncbi:hypothetical protein H6761_02060 [Candidatus Nomurabacteria bacterium]|nr:hypothetical protein [Candidatus Nomurabacteria bacterium]